MFDSRSQRRIAKSVRHTEKNLTPKVPVPVLAGVPEGSGRFFKLDADLAYDDDPGDAHMVFRVNDAWKDHPTNVKVDPCFFPNGKKLSEGALIYCVKSGHSWIGIGPQECFEDV